MGDTLYLFQSGSRIRNQGYQPGEKMTVKELAKENIKDIYPLSPMQEGMFFQWLYDNTSHAYFEQISYRLKADLDTTVVKRSLQELFKQYDILRTVFSRKKITRILQVVLKERSVDFYQENLSQRKDKKEAIDLIKYYSSYWTQFKSGSQGMSGKKTINPLSAFNDLFFVEDDNYVDEEEI
jgi:hypothetical protein